MFKKYNLFILFFLFNSFFTSNVQAQNYKEKNMKEFISEVADQYNKYKNDEQLLFEFNLMNLNDEEIREFIKNNDKLTSSLIEKINTTPQLWEIFDSEPIVGLVNINNFQFPNDITFDNKKFTITKIKDEQTIYSKQQIYRFYYNDTFLQFHLVIIPILDDKGNIEFSYKGARCSFISLFLNETLPIHEVYNITENRIGLFSISEYSNIYPNGKYYWIYKNAYVIASNRGIPEELFMEICHWLQQELEKNVTY